MRRYGLVDIPDQASDIDAVPITRTITIDGITYDLSANRSWTTSAGSISIGSSITSGTAGSVLFIGVGGVLAQDNANFFWDDTNNYLGIATNTPSYPLDVNGTGRFQDSLLVSKNQNAITSMNVSNTTNGVNSVSRYSAISTSNAKLEWGKYSPTTTTYKIVAGGDSYIYNNITGNISILNDFASGGIRLAAGASSTAQMTLTAAGRLLLGTTTESTFIFDVIGTARITGTTNIVSTSSSTSSSTYGLISNTTLTYSSGSTLSSNVVINGVQGGITHKPNGNLTILNSNIVSSTIGVSGIEFTNTGTITVNQGGATIRAISNYFAFIQKIDTSLSGTISHFANYQSFSPYSGTTGTTLTFTNFYGLLLNDLTQYSGIAITNKWGIYQEGSSDNNFFNGKVLIGTTTDAGYKLDVVGTSRANKFQLSALNTAPATSSSTGTLGEIRIDANHIYVCTATNTWKRVAIATF